MSVQDNVELNKLPDDQKISRDNLEIGKCIAEGNFGKVFTGELTTSKGRIDVACKVLTRTFKYVYKYVLKRNFVKISRILKLQRQPFLCYHFDIFKCI